MLLSRMERCATFVFIIGGDPTYDIIEDGAWLDNE
jgi:hypothetical protein